MMKSKQHSSKIINQLVYLSRFSDVLDVESNQLCLLDREESEGNLKGILGYTEDDVVSTDFVGDNR